MERRAVVATGLLLSLSLQAFPVLCLVSIFRNKLIRHDLKSSSIRFASTGIISGSDRIDRARLRLAEIKV